jgi:cobalamin synthase
LVHESVTAQARELGQAVATAPIVVTARSETWAVPWPLIVMVLVVLGLLFVLIHRRRRRRRAGGVLGDGDGETSGDASREVLAPDNDGELAAAAPVGEP